MWKEIFERFACSVFCTKILASVKSADYYSAETSDLQLLKKFPAFCGTRRFITAFTRARSQVN